MTEHVLVRVLAWTMLIGLSSMFTVEAARTTRWIDARVLRGERPWACNICMSLWTCLLTALVGAWLPVLLHAWPQAVGEPLMAWGPSCGLCYFLLELRGSLAPPGSPPVP